MNRIYVDKNEKLMNIVEIKKDKLLNNRKNYLHYIIIFILLILCLVIFLVFILKGKELNDEKKLNIFEQGYFLHDDDLTNDKNKNSSISNCEIYKRNKSDNYYHKKKLFN